MPHFSFNSNFSYSSANLTTYDVDPLSLVVYYDVADLTNSGMTVNNTPSSQTVLDTFNNLVLARKQTKATFVSSFEETASPVLGSTTVDGFYNLCAFSAEGSNTLCMAFNTLPTAGQLEHFCTRLVDFKHPRRGFRTIPTNGLVPRTITMANNCLHYPDLAQVVGVPVIFNQANQIGQPDQLILIKYPKKDQSPFTQITSDRYPDVLPAPGTNEHHQISMVSSLRAYYWTRGSGTSNTLRIIKMPYSVASTNAGTGNDDPIVFVEFQVRIDSAAASSTMWVDLANTLFIAHGGVVMLVQPELPEREKWNDNSFVNPVQYTIIQNPALTHTYTIERAVFHKKSLRHFALCSRNAIGDPRVMNDTTQYFCELIFDNNNQTVFVQEKNPTPIPIDYRANKQINIPIFADYAVYVCEDASITCCNLTDFSFKPLTAFMEFTDGAFRSQSDVKVISITQPTIDSSSNYLTVKHNTRFSVWKLKHLINNY